MADFYAARSSTMPPLTWTNFAPPFSASQRSSMVRHLAGYHLSNISGLSIRILTHSGISLFSPIRPAAGSSVFFTLDDVLSAAASEISVAKMTAKLHLSDEEKDKPKRRPIHDHIPRQDIELTTGDEDCGHCGGTLRRLGEAGEARTSHLSDPRH